MKEFKKGQPKPPPPERPAQEPGAQAPATGYQQLQSRPTGPATPLEYETLDLEADYQEKFALAVYGPAGSGKTRLLTTAPGIVGVVPLNRKTRQTVVEVAKKFDKKIVLPKFDLIRSSNPMKSARLAPHCDPEGKRPRIDVDIYRAQPECCAIHHGRWAVDRAKQAALDMVSQCDSIGIDGFDIFTEDLLTAHFGRTERIMARDRGPFNKEMIEFLTAISGKHVVLTMSEKTVWLNDKPTNKTDWAGWTHLNYHTSLIIRTKVREDYSEKKAEADEDYWRWSMDVILSQSNPALMGLAGEDLLTDDAITFPQLALRVFPESEYEDWI